MTLPARMLNRLKALVLILTAVFFAQKYASGTLYYYIGPRFAWLALVAVMLLITIGSAYDLPARRKAGGRGQNREHDRAAHSHDGAEPTSLDDEHSSDHEHGHDHASVWPLLFMALPLVLGVVVPVRPLGASAVASRGVAASVGEAADQSGRTLTIVPSERNVLDWVRAISAEPDPAAFSGQEADVVGFVYRDARFGDDQFMVARFTIACCVADATAIGLVVEAENASALQPDSWVRVRGQFSEGIFDGQTMPVLVADEVLPVQPPEQPYLYQ